MGQQIEYWENEGLQIYSIKKKTKKKRSDKYQTSENKKGIRQLESRVHSAGGKRSASQCRLRPSAMDGIVVKVVLREVGLFLDVMIGHIDAIVRGSVVNASFGAHGEVQTTITIGGIGHAPLRDAYSDAGPRGYTPGRIAFASRGALLSEVTVGSEVVDAEDDESGDDRDDGREHAGGHPESG